MTAQAATSDAAPRTRRRIRSQDWRAEYTLGALALGISVLVYAMLIFILIRAWPSFSHNGLSWFGGSFNADNQLQAIFDSATTAQGSGGYEYTLNAWSYIYATLIVCLPAVLISFVLSLFTSVFLVEFAPRRIAAIVTPSVRLLAGVPSVVYALIGVVVLVPFINNHVISDQQKTDVGYVVTLSGYSIGAGIVVLTMMISPIMIAIFSDGLRSVPHLWKEGSMALGVSKWRTCWKVTLRAARPAIVAGTILATARAIGEAVMLAMIAGTIGWRPNPADGFLFFLEPAKPVAAVILTHGDMLVVEPVQRTIFAFAALLLVTTMALSLIGWAIKQPLKKYGIRA